jgi:hypothetical protein
MKHDDLTLLDPSTLDLSAVAAHRIERREILRAGLFGLGAALLARPGLAQACGAGGPRSRGCVATEDNIEGPYYRRGAPQRDDLVTQGMLGTRLELEGSVFSTRCLPLAGAAIEIWQADARGNYDNAGYGLRGTLIAGAYGRYRLRTIVPGHYLNGDRYRPAHIHVKVRAEGHRPLTTQLYFAGDPYNAGDPWIRPSLVLAPTRDGATLRVQRDLVLVPA